MMLRGKKNTTSRLRHKLLLQQEVRLSDGVGGYAKSWQNIAELWAEIKPVSGNEQLFAGQVQSTASHKVLLRYRSGITVGMRFVFDGRTFNIRSVFNVDERRDTLELLVQEGVAT
ncbi:MAG: head-tail adaptor protein [Alphaproteobacteria bacterium]|nr:head-tail adaptor protein [Alphaproteobacteria bacterium]